MLADRGFLERNESMSDSFFPPRLRGGVCGEQAGQKNCDLLPILLYCMRIKKGEQ